MFDVENQFNKDGRYFPPEARDVVLERFQYRREYAEMQTREEEKKQIAELIGGQAVMKSTADEIIEDLNKPEIMGIDFSEYATQREDVIPPEIQKFYQTDRTTFFGRLAGGFRRIFRR